MYQIYFILEWHYTFRAVFPSIIRSSRLYIQQQAFVKQKHSPTYEDGTDSEFWNVGN